VPRSRLHHQASQASSEFFYILLRFFRASGARSLLRLPPPCELRCSPSPPCPLPGHLSFLRPSQLESGMVFARESVPLAPPFRPPGWDYNGQPISDARRFAYYSAITVAGHFLPPSPGVLENRKVAVIIHCMTRPLRPLCLTDAPPSDCLISLSRLLLHTGSRSLTPPPRTSANHLDSSSTLHRHFFQPHFFSRYPSGFFLREIDIAP